MPFCLLSLFCACLYTEWSKILCAPDDYGTNTCTQRLFDHPVFVIVILMSYVIERNAL